MTVHAPFAFAPVSRFVHFPAWADLVSHDMPFRDGLCGTVGLTITARTPLLVGGPRRKATGEGAGEVWPIRLPDGTYAIPGSTFQGHVRALIDVATFGKLGPFVQSRRYGVRDLTGSSTTADSIYKSRISKLDAQRVINPQARAGWLWKSETGHVVVPCELARIRFDEIVRENDRRMQILLSGNNARQRYNGLLAAESLASLEGQYHLDPVTVYSHQGGTIRIRYQRAFREPAPGRKTVNGTLVLTGKTSPSSILSERSKKKFEFLFHSPRRSEIQSRAPKAIPLTLDVWQDFLLIHEKQHGRDANPNWDFWRGEYEAGRPVPIFYLWEADPITGVERITTLGTAFMFKVAHRLSTHDLLRYSTPDHLDPSDDTADPEKPFRMDLGSLIFGVVADRDSGKGLKRRAAFDLARATTIPGDGRSERSQPTVLLSPKPSYYPIYVRQPSPEARKGFKNDIYATYSPPQDGHHPPQVRQPELAGVKIWPTTGTSRFPALPPPPQNVRGEAAKIVLNALPAGTVMTTALRVHNLRLVELGALLWALTFGNQQALAGGETPLRHSLGMGKPFQMGQVEIRLAGTDLTPNDPAASEPTGGWAAAAVAAFEAYMETVYPTEGPESGWKESAQVKALLKAADPTCNVGRKLAYMELGTPRASDTYVGERARREFLAPYADGHEIAEPRKAPLHGSPRHQQLLAVVGARVRAKMSPNAEGVIVALQAHGRAQIKFDAGGKTGRNLADFDILSSPGEESGP